MDVVTLGAALNGSKKYTDQVTQSLMGGVHYRGSVSYYDDLPNDAEEGDSYTVKYAGTSGSVADGTEYTWGYDTDSQTYAWISFSKDSYSKAETDDTFVKKVDEYNAGKTVPQGTSVTIDGQTYTVSAGAEVFNNYSGNKAVGAFSHAEGVNTKAIGDYSHAEGNSKASAMFSHSEGDSTTASGQASHAEGYGTEALQKYSHAEGDDTSANGQGAHTEGGKTTATGYAAHAEGDSTSAGGQGAHAEGMSSTASNSAAHAEGLFATASAAGSHAEGMLTTAGGEHSHAEGNSTIASGARSHAEGQATKASSANQHVEGKYNVEDSNDKFAHIIGNGTADNARSNAFAVDWDGKIYTHNANTGFDIQSNYIEFPNGQRLYNSSTAPTGNIPDGSIGIGW